MNQNDQIDILPNNQLTCKLTECWSKIGGTILLPLCFVFMLLDRKYHESEIVYYEV